MKYAAKFFVMGPLKTASGSLMRESVLDVTATKGLSACVRRSSTVTSGTAVTRPPTTPDGKIFRRTAAAYSGAAATGTPSGGTGEPVAIS